MPRLGSLRATLWLRRAMSLGVLEPRPPGKRWLVSGVGGGGVLGGGRSVHLQVPVELQLLRMALGTWRNLRFFICEMGLIAVPPHESCESGQPPPPGLMGSNQGHCCLCPAELFGLTAEEVYLVHDELDKPLGKLALKLGGSSRQCRGCGWALGARHTLTRCRPTYWAISPPLKRSCCLHCWSELPTCSWTTSVSEARAPHQALSSLDTCLPDHHAHTPSHVHRGATPTCGICFL
uniref:Peptidyl-tRNA hydrolase 1 homolog n=1 Tax=Ursus maritimus TaxID=29073 RepID=A0A452SZH0_URSMA